MTSSYNVDRCYRAGRKGPLTAHVCSYPGMTVHQSRDQDKKPRDLYFVYDATSVSSSLSPTYRIKKVNDQRYHVFRVADDTRVAVLLSLVKALNFCHRNIQGVQLKGSTHYE